MIAIAIYLFAAFGACVIFRWCCQEWKRYTPGGPTIFDRPVVNQRSIHG
jgi:hypothetical protein